MAKKKKAKAKAEKAKPAVKKPRGPAAKDKMVPDGFVPVEIARKLHPPKKDKEEKEK